MPRPIPWTADEVQLLKTMAKDGRTGQQVGDALGKSRSSILGKASTLGIKFGNNDKKSVIQNPRKPRTPPRAILKVVPKAPLPPVTHRKRRALLTEPTNPPVPLLELRTGHCRWPVEGGFCGAECSDTNPKVWYCDWHARKSVQPYIRRA